MYAGEEQLRATHFNRAWWDAVQFGVSSSNHVTRLGQQSTSVHQLSMNASLKEWTDGTRQTCFCSFYPTLHMVSPNPEWEWSINEEYFIATQFNCTLVALHMPRTVRGYGLTALFGNCTMFCTYHSFHPSEQTYYRAEESGTGLQGHSEFNFLIPHSPKGQTGGWTSLRWILTTIMCFTIMSKMSGELVHFYHSTEWDTHHLCFSGSSAGATDNTPGMQGHNSSLKKKV